MQLIENNIKLKINSLIFNIFNVQFKYAIMKTKLLFFLSIAGALLFSNTTNAQTVLAPGDIVVFWNQADTPDGFAFVTFVDLDPGTVIYFTDCGVVPAGTFDPAGCGEGAVAYTVPVGGKAIGDVVQWADGVADFADYPGDATILGGSGPSFSTGGDQIIVFQANGSPGGSPTAGTNPTFIFVNNNASTLFTGDDSNSTTETGLPIGLSDVTTPRTALGLGSGTGASQEYDNTVYNGTYVFSTVADAKLALTDPANYTGANGITDAPYQAQVGAIPGKLTILSLTTEEFDAQNVVMYPNPANSFITISGNQLDINEVRIFDITGKEVIRTNAVQDQIDISPLNSGVYLVNILGNDIDVVKKLIKQ